MKSKKMKNLKKDHNFFQFDFSKVVELTEEELKTKVNGGQSLTPAEQYEIAQKAAKGDLSGVSSVKSSETNNILSYGDSNLKTSSIDIREARDVPEKKGSLDIKEAKDPVSFAEKETVSKTTGSSSKSSSSTSSGSSSSSSGSSYSGNSGSSTSSNTSSNYSPNRIDDESKTNKIGEFQKESDQTFEMEVDYTKNGSDTLGINIRTRNKDGTYDYSNGKVKSIYFNNVTNKVKTPEERNNKPVYFESGDYYYFPEQFPDGNWEITGTCEKKDIETFGPVAIRTNAFMYVDEYNSDGTKTGNQVYDSGYLIHSGINPTTWGCLKMDNDNDLLNFANLTDNVLTGSGNISLKVCDYDKIFK